MFGFPKGSAWFPYASPALFTIPLSFLCSSLFSVTDSSKTASTEQAAFEAQYVRSQTGIGADSRDRPLGGRPARRKFCALEFCFRCPEPCRSFLIGGPRALKSSATKVVMAGIRPSRKP